MKLITQLTEYENHLAIVIIYNSAGLDFSKWGYVERQNTLLFIVRC